MKKIALFISGDGIFANYVFENLAILKDTQIAAVICDRMEKAYHAFSARREILALAVDYAQGRENAERVILEALSPLGIDSIFLTYDRIIGKTLLEKYPGRIFNLHLSLLPLYPMLHAADRSTTGNELFFGSTFHEVTAEVDGGRILGQLLLPKDPEKSPLEHRIELLEKSRLFFLDMIYKVLFESAVAKDGTVSFPRAAYGAAPFNPRLSISIPL